MASGDLRLKSDSNGQIAQMWVETPGNGQLTSGTKEGVTALWCNAAGNVTITFPGSDPESRAYAAGDMVTFPGTVSVAIEADSGTFSFMVA